jgi:hypothetical protein
VLPAAAAGESAAGAGTLDRLLERAAAGSREGRDVRVVLRASLLLQVRLG